MCRGISLPASLQPTIRMYDPVAMRPKKYYHIDQWIAHAFYIVVNQIKVFAQGRFSKEQIAASIPSFSMHNYRCLTAKQLSELTLTEAQLTSFIVQFYLEARIGEGWTLRDPSDQTLINTVIDNLTTEQLIKLCNDRTAKLLLDIICRRRFSNPPADKVEDMYRVFKEMARVDLPRLLFHSSPDAYMNLLKKPENRSDLFDLLTNIAKAPEGDMFVCHFKEAILGYCLEVTELSVKEIRQIEEAVSAMITAGRGQDFRSFGSPGGLNLDKLLELGLIPEILDSGSPKEHFKRQLYVAAGKQPERFYEALKKHSQKWDETDVMARYNAKPDFEWKRLHPITQEQQKHAEQALAIRKRVLIERGREIVDEPDRKLKSAGTPIMNRVAQMFTWEQRDKITHLLAAFPKAPTDFHEIYTNMSAIVKQGINESNLAELTALLLECINQGANTDSRRVMVATLFENHISKLDVDWLLLRTCLWKFIGQA